MRFILLSRGIPYHLLGIFPIVGREYRPYDELMINHSENDQGPCSESKGEKPDRAQQERERATEKVEQLTTHSGIHRLPPEEEAVFRQALQALKGAGIRFLLAGAFAKYLYTGLWRYTKDMDVFLKPEDLSAALEALERSGFETEVTDERWIAKAYRGDEMVDLIFNSGNGQVSFNEQLFKGSRKGELFGEEVQVLSIEEIITLGLFVAAHDRFDGSETVHLILQMEGKLDWERILERLGDSWELLLWSLILFDYVYPGHSDYLPKDLMVRLFDRVRQRWENPRARAKDFRGTLLDPYSYNVDIEQWGYEDLRHSRPKINLDGKEE